MCEGALTDNSFTDNAFRPLALFGKNRPRRVVIAPLKQLPMEARGHTVRFLISTQHCKTMKDAGLRRQRVDDGIESHLLSAVACKRSRLQAQIALALAPGLHIARQCTITTNCVN